MDGVLGNTLVVSEQICAQLLIHTYNTAATQLPITSLPNPALLSHRASPINSHS